MQEPLAMFKPLQWVLPMSHTHAHAHTNTHTYTHTHTHTHTNTQSLAESLDAATRPEDPYFNKLVRILSTRCMTQALYFCSGDHGAHFSGHW
jgi:hypothetical protein